MCYNVLSRGDGKGRVETMEWEKVAVAPDQLTAEMWREILLDQGIPTMIRPGDVTSFLGVSAMPVALLVPTDRVSEAKDVLDGLEEGGEPGSGEEAGEMEK